MFNLLITSDENAWDKSQGIYTFQRNRLFEYTDNQIEIRYKELDTKSLKELKSFPTLFIIEREIKPAKIGYINNIEIRSESGIEISYEVDHNFKELPLGTIERLTEKLGLDEWEISRTHWAIKNENLLSLLLSEKLITEAQISASETSKKALYPLPEPSQNRPDTSKVFIVHGSDESVKNDVAGFVKEMGLHPIILNEQPNAGSTIIEKIDKYSNVGFALVLYTECDIGFKKGHLNGKYRSRQNVIFEHGYFTAKLGRNKVAVIVKGDIERPNDISGLVYIEMNNDNNWQNSIKQELKHAGYAVRE